MFMYYRMPELLKAYSSLTQDAQDMFDLTKFVSENRPFSDIYIIPLRGQTLSFQNKEEAVDFLAGIEVLENNSIFRNLMLVCGDDFDAIEGGFSLSYVTSNLGKFKFDGSLGRIVYSNSHSKDQESVRYCCCETVGDCEDRIADAFKMIEVLLLLLTDNLTEGQKQEFKDAMSAIIPDTDLVVTKKYFDPADFTKVFLERQSKIRKILDRK